MQTYIVQMYSLMVMAESIEEVAVLLEKAYFTDPKITLHKCRIAPYEFQHPEWELTFSFSKPDGRCRGGVRTWEHHVLVETFPEIQSGRFYSFEDLGFPNCDECYP